MNVSECICFCYFHNWLGELAYIQGIVHIWYNYYNRKYCFHFLAIMLRTGNGEKHKILSLVFFLIDFMIHKLWSRAISHRDVLQYCVMAEVVLKKLVKETIFSNFLKRNGSHSGLTWNPIIIQFLAEILVLEIVSAS